jgi:transposase-like protein
MATMEFKKRIRIITVKAFRAKFSSEEGCLEYLAKHRWPNGFVCPKCHNREAHWQAGRSIYWCKACEYQVSVTAGTVFHSTNLGLPDWFWAVYRMAQGKKGFSAMQLMKEIDVSYPTAWSVLHKIRCAMEERDKQYKLKGTIELDDAYLGGESKGKRGRGAEGKTPILVAVEKRQTRKGTKPGYVAIRIGKSLSSVDVMAFVDSKIIPGSIIETDGLSVYKVLCNLNFAHKQTVTENGFEAKELFPWVHLVIGNLKRFILGTHHHADPKYLRLYVAEYCYRLNRRFHEDDLFEHLLKACLLISPRKYNILGH